MNTVVVELVLTRLDRRTPGQALTEVRDLLPDPRQAVGWCHDDETCERIAIGLRRADV